VKEDVHEREFRVYLDGDVEWAWYITTLEMEEVRNEERSRFPAVSISVFVYCTFRYHLLFLELFLFCMQKVEWTVR